GWPPGRAAPTGLNRRDDDPRRGAFDGRSGPRDAPRSVVDESDESLMLRAGRGDRAACELLVERHLGRVVTFARRSLGSAGEAEDAAQEVFLRVWAAAPQWTLGTARFTTWLHRVALNVCLDRMKKHEPTMDELGELPDPRPDPSAEGDAADVSRRVSRALARLPA